MFNVKSITLTAALFGFNAVEAQTPCSSVYVQGSTYAVDDLVSATVTTTTPDNFVACSPAGEGACPASGFINTGGVSTTTVQNYKCISANWCGSSGYGPGETYQSTAWSVEGLCSVSLGWLCSA